MSGHLLIIALGPVQDFIAQARRTRDLWFGSHVLSELSRRAAWALAEGEAELIFPALKKGDAELEASPGLLRSNLQPPQNVANKLVAEVPATVDPRALASNARNAVLHFWRDEIAAKVKARCRGLLAEGVDEVWREQIETLLEFHAAWAPLDGRPYREVRESVENALAGHKALRDFVPWSQQRRGVNKSTLDGARETVLALPRQRDASLVRDHRITGREELDAVGLVKRAGGQPGQFVPVVNIAAVGWLEHVKQAAPGEFAGLIDACKGLDRYRHSPVGGRTQCAKLFGFEASVLFSNRQVPAWAELTALSSTEVPAGELEAWRRRLAPLYERFGEPCPYVVCLMADGDGVGGALNELTSPDAQRAFSRALANFAARARAIVEQEHRGALVYAGGDDVLAFLPLPYALTCADALRKLFEKTMEEALPAGERVASASRPTLSVGLGVGHMLESLGDLLALGREAEKRAKGTELRSQGRDRNALAVLVAKRTGDRRLWRARWPDDPVARLGAAIEAGPRLPSRKIYEVARLLGRLPKPREVNDSEWAEVLSLEVGRSLARVDAGGAPLTPEDVGLRLTARISAEGGEPDREGVASYAAVRTEVDDWVNRMLVARLFAKAGPRPGDASVGHDRSVSHDGRAS